MNIPRTDRQYPGRKAPARVQPTPYAIPPKNPAADTVGRPMTAAENDALINTPSTMRQRRLDRLSKAGVDINRVEGSAKPNEPLGVGQVEGGPGDIVQGVIREAGNAAHAIGSSVRGAFNSVFGNPLDLGQTPAQAVEGPSPMEQIKSLHADDFIPPSE